MGSSKEEKAKKGKNNAAAYVPQCARPLDLRHQAQTDGRANTAHNSTRCVTERVPVLVTTYLPTYIVTDIARKHVCTLLPHRVLRAVSLILRRRISRRHRHVVAKCVAKSRSDSFFSLFFFRQVTSYHQPATSHTLRLRVFLQSVLLLFSAPKCQ